jgi:hypothetical protein
MKKVEFFNVSRLKLVAIIYLLLCFTTTCTKTNQRSFEELTSSYAELGKNHQLGLDCILEDLKVIKSASVEELNLDQLFKEVQKTSIGFTIEKLGLDISAENDLLSIQEAMISLLTKSDVDLSIIEMTSGQIPLTNNEIQYLTKLDDILASVSIGVNQCTNSIRNLEYEIYSSCSSEEIDFLFIATSIGASSVEYWYNNYDIWAEELQIPELIDQKGIAHKDWFWSSLSRMGRMDIIGGITGAACGALAGGVGAIPGALAGACVASGNCGIVCLYEHLVE